VDKAAAAHNDGTENAFGTGLTTRRQGAAWTTRQALFHAHRGQRSKLMADTWPTIDAVTQAPHPGCPRSPGTLSAISLEWVSAISGMRTYLGVFCDA
jgi:hypothetical protein